MNRAVRVALEGRVDDSIGGPVTVTHGATGQRLTVDRVFMGTLVEEFVAECVRLGIWATLPEQHLDIDPDMLPGDDCGEPFCACATCRVRAAITFLLPRLQLGLDEGYFSAERI